MAETIVYHFGPDPASLGGMASVLRTYARYGIGGQGRVIPTWAPGSGLCRIRLGLAATKAVASVPDSAIAHVHLSERGSFIREGIILMVAHARGLATVATIHGATFPSFATDHPHLTACVLSHAEVVVCLSEATRERVLQMVPGVSAVYIPNPVVVDDGSPPASATEQVVLFAGEIGVRKGADILVRAWERIARICPDARCVLAGPATALTIGGQERLAVVGSLSESALRALVREARVVVLPSRAEAMPMILVEAQAARRPFIATPVGGIPSLAEHGGVLVPVGDVGKLAEAVIDLLQRPERATALGLQGQAYVRANASIKVVDAKLRSVYGSLRD